MIGHIQLVMQQVRGGSSSRDDRAYITHKASSSRGQGTIGSKKYVMRGMGMEELMKILMKDPAYREEIKNRQESCNGWSQVLDIQKGNVMIQQVRGGLPVDMIGQTPLMISEIAPLQDFILTSSLVRPTLGILRRREDSILNTNSRENSSLSNTMM